MKKTRVFSMLAAFLVIAANMLGATSAFAEEFSQTELNDEVEASDLETDPADVVEEDQDESVLDEDDSSSVSDIEEDQSSSDPADETDQPSSAPVLEVGRLSAPALLTRSNVTEVSNGPELAQAVLDQASSIKVTADFSVNNCANRESDWLGYFDINTTLDLNGHTITQESGCNYFIVRDGGNLTITGNGKIVKNYHDTTGSPVIWVYKSGTLTLESGEISGSDYAVRVNASESSYEAAFIMTGGKITSDGYGIVGVGETTTTINGGSISAGEVAFSGNGSQDAAGAKLYINGGTLTSTGSHAVYLPQINGETVITGGIITGAETGIEIRAGSLDISGGVINGNGTSYAVSANGNGTTTDGAAVAIAQHTTKQPINVSISGGIFNAIMPISEANPQNNSAEDLAKVTLSVTGGEFNTTGDTPETSNDKTKYISGGTFSKAPSVESIADGYDAYQLPSGEWVVDKKAVVNFPTQPAFLQVGETYDISGVLDETAKKYAEISTQQISLSGDTITATTVGRGFAMVNLHNLINPIERMIEVVTYEVTFDSNDDMVKDSDRRAVAAFVANQLKKDFAAGTTYDDEYISFDSLYTIKELLLNNQSVVVRFEMEYLGDDFEDLEYDIEAYDEVAAKINSNENIAGSYLGFLRIYIGNYVIGLAYETDTTAQLAVEIPEQYRNAPAGYTRIFYIIRGHLALDYSESATRLTATRSGNDLLFGNNKFSSFTITYRDIYTGTPATSPNTGIFTNLGTSSAEIIQNDSIELIIMISALATVFGAVTFAKRR